jgi:crotonobetainyl-CoA:carnitine CoA-transferase CaiB-like acyl-CoA transferase
VTHPLAGVRVLDVGTLTPGKYCTYLLAGLGADVTRVERPLANPRRIDDEDLILNQGKHSVSLNLRTEAGRAQFLELAERTDVIVEGNRPGTADRNGFGYDAVRGRNEKIVYCALSGYGATGPLSQSPGYDLIFLALCGLMSTLTGKDAAPSAPQTYLADGVTGMSAACAIVVALFARERTGHGTFLDLAMLDSAFSLLAVSHGVRRQDGEPAQPGAEPTYDVYAAADGTHVSLGAIRRSSTAALFTHLGRPDLAEPGRADESQLFLEETFRAKPADAWVAELSPLDIEIGRVNSPSEAFDHPQLRDRGMIGKAHHVDVGEFEFIRSSLVTATGGAQTLRPAPRVGEHTEQVLEALGVDQSRLAALRNDGII